jgi:flavin reductase (DIM6/NTAB) family NADH-FMN oxidoreductase RutF
VQLDPASAQPQSVYKLLIGCVVPRPIAWVSCVDTDGIMNLAPFSFFMGVCGRPPTIAFSCGSRSGVVKDTARIIERTKEFVVNVVDAANAEVMNATSAEWGPEVDEFKATGLTPLPSVKINAPRVAESPVNMECRLVQSIPVGTDGYNLVLGEIVYFHVRDDIYDEATGRINMQELRAVGRLAGNSYTQVENIFDIKRPNENYAG